MRSIKGMMREATEMGSLWVCGEMEFPTNQGPRVAYDQAVMVAEACGYSVGWKYGHSRSAFSVSGSEVINELVFDWYAPAENRVLDVRNGLFNLDKL